MNPRTIHLVIEPRDGWFFKTGQGWHVAGSGRSKSFPWPFPSTITGALRTAVGRGVEAVGSRGPLSAAEWATVASGVQLDTMLALRRKADPGSTEPWMAAHRLWPAPHDAVAVHREGGGSRIETLVPVAVTETVLGSGDAGDDLPLWWPVSENRGKPARMAPWWSDSLFTEWLVDARTRDLSDKDLMASPEQRRSVHVSLDVETGTVDEGKLFATEVVESRDTRKGEWAIAIRGRVEGNESADIAPLVLGGNGYLGFPGSVSETLFAMPEAVASAFERAKPRGLRLVAVTPAIFELGWLPDTLKRVDGAFLGHLPGVAEEVVLRAAFVGRPLQVSGWDVAREEPKPTTRLVPPGSVYFLERVDGAPFSADDARALWLVGLGERQEEGFGRFVAGTWASTRPMGDSR